MKKILVTGATGYIAKHIILQLLQAGYAVRGSLRGSAKETALRDAMTKALGQDPGARLEFAHLDLTLDDGWDTALQGVDGLFHTASPLTFTPPKGENELIRPAVDGTVRALNAAHKAGVKRVVLTSSVVAITGTDKRSGQAFFDEQDWSDVKSPLTSAYDRSKTLAERSAWEIAKTHDIDLTTINPGLVLGAPVDDAYGASLGLIERFMEGKDPMAPNFGVVIVHVKDVAAAHIKAFENDSSIGERIIVANEWFWLPEVTRMLKDQFPNRRIPVRQAPDFLIKFLALFDRSIKPVVPNLGRNAATSNAKAKTLLGMEFISGKDALLETGKYLAAQMDKK